MTYEIIKRNYEKKLWNKQMVAIAVVKVSSQMCSTRRSQGMTMWPPASIPKSTQQAVAEHEEAINELAGV